MKSHTHTHMYLCTYVNVQLPKDRGENWDKDTHALQHRKHSNATTVWDTGRTHQSTEPTECPGDAQFGIHFNEDILAGLDVDLQKSCLVQGAVQKGQQTLCCDRTRSDHKSHFMTRTVTGTQAYIHRHQHTFLLEGMRERVGLGDRMAKGGRGTAPDV